MSQSWLIASGKGGVGKSMVTAALGVALMLSSWGVLRLIEKRMRSARVWQPRIVAVHEEGEEQNGNDADG